MDDRKATLHPNEIEAQAQSRRFEKAPRPVKERSTSSDPILWTQPQPTLNKSKSLIDMLSHGGDGIRRTPTYSSSVLPLGQPATEAASSKPAGNKQAQENKWTVSKEDVIPEKPQKDSKSKMYKMYMGIKETPFQRFFKELYGSKVAPPEVSNVKKQEVISTNQHFNTHTNKKGVYGDLDAKGRRAKELDS